MSSLGLVVIDHCFVRYGVDETYTFLHLTFQEYLAAVHIAGLGESQQLDIIKAHHGKRHLSVVWRFLCGMMNYTSSTACKMDTLKSWMGRLMGGVMDFTSDSAMYIFRILMETTSDKLYKVQCCYESQHSLPCTHVIGCFDGHIELNNRNLSPSDCIATVSYTHLTLPTIYSV